MPPRSKPGTSIRLLLGALAVAPPVAVIAAIPWLKQQPDGIVFLLTGVAAATTLISTFVLGIVYDRRLDEWHRSNARFSTQWGWTAGASIVALLLSLPAFRDFIVSLTASIVRAPDPNHTLVLLAFTLGFAGVVIAQGICTVLISIVWSLWMSRASRDAA